MLRALAVSLLLVTPAMADDPLDLVSLVFAGLKPGAAGQVSGAGPVERLGPGLYRGTPADGIEFRFAVKATGPCAFEMMTGLGDMTPRGVRLDLGQVTGIHIGQLQGDRIRVTIDGPPGLAEVQAPDGTWFPSANVTEYETSVPQAELEAAALALRSACPGP
jgi:hypothetical protein